MFKKSLLAAAIMSVSFGAAADWSLDSNPKNIQQEIFGQGAVQFTPSTFVELVTDKDIPAEQSAKITFTLSDGVVFNATASSNIFHGFNGAANDTWDVVRTAGGNVGDSSVTYRITTTAIIDASGSNNFLKLNLPVLLGDLSNGGSTVISTNFVAESGSTLFDTDVNVIENMVAQGVPGYVVTVTPGTALVANPATGILDLTAGATLGTITIADNSALPSGATSLTPADIATVTVVGDFSNFTSTELDDGTTQYAGVTSDDRQSATYEVDASIFSSAVALDVINTSSTAIMKTSRYSASVDIDFDSDTYSDFESESAVIGEIKYTAISNGRAMVVTKDGSSSITSVRLTNLKSSDVTLFAQLTTADGEVRPMVKLDDVPANATVYLNSADIEAELGGSFTGRSNIDFFSSTADNLKIINLIKTNGIQNQIQ